jgi:hypothetical protein
VIEKSKKQQLVLGKDYGMISYNEPDLLDMYKDSAELYSVPVKIGYKAL